MRFWVAAVAMLCACGDPPVCPGEVFVAIQTTQITADVDPTIPGVQADIHVKTSAAEGDTVVLDVSAMDGGSLGSRTAMVDADGNAVFEAVTVASPATVFDATADTVCGPGTDHVTADVMLGDPQLAVVFVSPPLPCGAQVTPSVDIDAAHPGVQIGVRVTASADANKTLEITTPSGSTAIEANEDLVVTLEPGTNHFVGETTDVFGGILRTPACDLTLSDLAVSFAAPASTGLLGRGDGVVTGSDLTLDVCGSVNRPGATVAVSVDGGAGLPATVTGTGWCRSLTLSEAAVHTLSATATLGSAFGSATLGVRVDLTPPPAVTDFGAAAINRERLHVDWDAPNDFGQPAASYILKLATTNITEGNFDAIGQTIATGAPQAPGTAEAATIPVRPGTAYWVGLATVDAAGNRSPAQIAGPITPGFDRTGAITGPDPSQGALGLGYAIAHGKFNDDDLDDIAIAAPSQDVAGLVQAGAVYIYFGTAAGISPSPDVTITGTTANGRFGSGLARVRWSSATRDDLAVGQPGGDGAVLVFDGGATIVAGTRSATTADLRIAASSSGFFAASALGSTLVSADVDSDGVLDLVASAPRGGGTIGGIAVLYGGTVTADTVLTDTDASGATVELFVDPDALANHQIGFYLHAIGGNALAVGEQDDYTQPNATLYILRGDGTRPPAGVTARPFRAGDTRITHVTSLVLTEFGSQVIGIEDQNGDGVRDLVVSAYRASGGQVFILSGAAVGNVNTTDPGVKLSTIVGTNNARFGAAVLGHDDTFTGDIDGDGHEDLAIAGAPGNVGKLFVWFGGSIPAGNSSQTTAQLVLDAPSTMTFARQLPKGFAGRATWVGDVDGDGLQDLCWASPFDNGGDGSFEVLAD